MLHVTHVVASQLCGVGHFTWVLRFIFLPGTTTASARVHRGSIRALRLYSLMLLLDVRVQGWVGQITFAAAATFKVSALIIVL